MHSSESKKTSVFSFFATKKFHIISRFAQLKWKNIHTVQSESMKTGNWKPFQDFIHNAVFHTKFEMCSVLRITLKLWAVLMHWFAKLFSRFQSSASKKMAKINTMNVWKQWYARSIMLGNFFLWNLERFPHILTELYTYKGNSMKALLILSRQKKCIPLIFCIWLQNLFK